MADSETDARRERLKKAREALGTPAKPQGLRHPDVEGDDPLGDGGDASASQVRGGGLRGRLGQGGGGLRGGAGGGLRGQGGLGGGGLRGGGAGGGLRGQGGLGGGGLRGGGAGGGLRGQGGLGGGGLRGRLGQGGGGLRGGGAGGGLRGRFGQGGGAAAAQQGGNGANSGGDPAAQRAFLQERLEKLQARLAEIDTEIEDATIVEESPGPSRNTD